MLPIFPTRLNDTSRPCMSKTPTPPPESALSSATIRLCDGSAGLRQTALSSASSPLSPGKRSVSTAATTPGGPPPPLVGTGPPGRISGTTPSDAGPDAAVRVVVVVAVACGPPADRVGEAPGVGAPVGAVVGDPVRDGEAVGGGVVEGCPVGRGVVDSVGRTVTTGSLVEVPVKNCTLRVAAPRSTVAMTTRPALLTAIPHPCHRCMIDQHSNPHDEDRKPWRGLPRPRRSPTVCL